MYNTGNYKSHQTCLHLLVSCQLFYRHVYYNGGQWEEMLFGQQGNFFLQYCKWPLSQIESRAEWHPPI